jgi:Rieske Fe-S protein
MSQMNRREFVAAVACAACLCGLGGGTELLADDAPTSNPSTLDVGPKSSYTTDGITTTWIKPPDQVAVVRQNGKIFAFTTICTHRRGALYKESDAESFKCPRHGATFDVDGTVTGGPAKRSLNRFAISADASGHLIVDKSKTFAADQWDNPASFVTV